MPDRDNSLAKETIQSYGMRIHAGGIDAIYESPVPDGIKNNAQMISELLYITGFSKTKLAKKIGMHAASLEGMAFDVHRRNKKIYDYAKTVKGLNLSNLDPDAVIESIIYKIPIHISGGLDRTKPIPLGEPLYKYCHARIFCNGNNKFVMGRDLKVGMKIKQANNKYLKKRNCKTGSDAWDEFKATITEINRKGHIKGSFCAKLPAWWV
jgi:hypothetical protein